MSYKGQTGAGQRREMNRALRNADFNLMLWKTRRTKPVGRIARIGFSAQVGS
jgi:hypothetical protein